jgi:hypothetical protein
MPLGRPFGDGWLTGWWSDLRFGARMLARAPAFAAIVVLVIALGIGSNTVIFTALDAVLFRPPPGVRDAEELAVVFTSDFGGPRFGASSYPDYQAIRDEPDLFESAAVHGAQTFGVTVEGWRGQVMGGVVSANYFAVLGVAPALGRFFGAEEEGAAGTSSVVVIGHDLWQARFGGAAEAIGAELRVNGEPLTVIGVAPEVFGGSLRGLELQLWLPLSASSGLTGLDPTQRSSRHGSTPPSRSSGRT